MAEAAVQELDTAKPDRKSGLLVTVLVGLLAGLGGFSLPLFLPSLVGLSRAAPTAIDIQPTFIPFGSVVANLNDGRMTRFLKVTITLQVTGTEELRQKVQETMSAKRTLLVNWLLSYLADKSMEDIRGTAGQNRLRRDIHDQFNEVLFPDGEGQIDNVLFEEFNVQ
jgi:flagellar basal body-associated protein FliL